MPRVSFKDQILGLCDHVQQWDAKRLKQSKEGQIVLYASKIVLNPKTTTNELKELRSTINVKELQDAIGSNSVHLSHQVAKKLIQVQLGNVALWKAILARTYPTESQIRALKDFVHDHLNILNQMFLKRLKRLNNDSFEFSRKHQKQIKSYTSQAKEIEKILSRGSGSMSLQEIYEQWEPVSDLVEAFDVDGSFAEVRDFARTERNKSFPALVRAKIEIHCSDRQSGGNIVVRREEIHKTDFESLLQYIRHSQCQSLSEFYITQSVFDSSIIFVARQESDKAIRGFILLQVLCPDVMEITILCANGVGKTLMSAAKEFAEKIHCKYMFLLSVETAVSFYLHNGFVGVPRFTLRPVCESDPKEISQDRSEKLKKEERDILQAVRGGEKVPLALLRNYTRNFPDNPDGYAMVYDIQHRLV